jgi:hypothetical protein
MMPPPPLSSFRRGISIAVFSDIFSFPCRVFLFEIIRHLADAAMPLIRAFSPGQFSSADIFSPPIIHSSMLCRVIRPRYAATSDAITPPEPR